MVFGKIRSGKTHLITRGLLSLCESDRVLIIDAKGDDPEWEGYGRPVREIPADLASGGARDFWYRLVADRDPKTARAQIARALGTVAAEGHFIVVVDEVRALTDNRPPALGLRAELDQISVLGGSRNISLIAGTQETQWMPSTIANQPSFQWIGQVTNSEQRKKVAAMCGQSPQSMEPVLSAVGKRQFLYVDHEDGEPVMGVTGLE